MASEEDDFFWNDWADYIGNVPNKDDKEPDLRSGPKPIVDKNGKRYPKEDKL